MLRMLWIAVNHGNSPKVLRYLYVFVDFPSKAAVIWQPCNSGTSWSGRKLAIRSLAVWTLATLVKATVTKTQGSYVPRWNWNIRLGWIELISDLPLSCIFPKLCPCISFATYLDHSVQCEESQGFDHTICTRMVWGPGPETARAASLTQGSVSSHTKFT